MREQLAWAQWWAFPWKQAHEDWRGEEDRAIERLFYNGRSVPDNLTGFKACLPAAPHATVLRLALATTDQLNLGLALVTHIFNPEAPSPLSESHHQWCMRLSMALHPSMLPPHSDPLRLLHSWVEPAIVEMHKCLIGNKIPPMAAECDFCRYRQAVGEVEK